MANKIQIKRSVANSSVTGLSNGELAFTQNGNILYIGSPDGNSTPIPIGGKFNYGTLTANQALVTNATSGINKIIVGNAVISTLWANGSGGSAGQVLVSDGANVYWGTGTSGSNTYVQFNDSGVANGVAGFTFDKVSNTLTIGNTVSATYFSGNGASVTSVNAAKVGGNTASDLNTYADNKAANAYSNAISYAGNAAANAYSNAVSYADNKSANAYSNAVSYADNAAANAYSNAVSYADNKAANAYSNAMSDTLSRSGSYTGNNSFGGTNTVISSNLTVSGSTVTINTINVNGSAVLGDNSSDVVAFVAGVNTNILPSANSTYDLGSAGMRWSHVHANTINAVAASFSGSVSIGGDINVVGNLVTSNVSSVIVSDPLIYLAGNNYTSDLLDIGFAANYNDGTDRHTGLFRDHTDGIWKLFYNLTQELSGNNDIDTSDASYRTATLQTYLTSGALTTNTSALQITANSSYAVNITANSITLSTPLSATSGGTGYNSFTAGDILTAANSTYLSKLSLGTSGYVLQSNGTALVYDVLDGGTF